MHKKKTSTKKNEKSPTFNEAMIFNIPAHSLQVNFNNLLFKFNYILMTYVFIDNQ